MLILELPKNDNQNAIKKKKISERDVKLYTHIYIIKSALNDGIFKYYFYELSR